MGGGEKAVSEPEDRAGTHPGESVSVKKSLCSFPSSITFAGGPGRDGIIDFTPGSELLITKAKNGHLAVVRLAGNTLLPADGPWARVGPPVAKLSLAVLGRASAFYSWSQSKGYHVTIPFIPLPVHEGPDRGAI